VIERRSGRVQPRLGIPWSDRFIPHDAPLGLHRGVGHSREITSVTGEADGGKSRFCSSSGRPVDSTKPIVAAHRGRNPTATYWIVIRRGSNTGRGTLAGTPAAVQST
jgi:hypothetical protein